MYPPPPGSSMQSPPHIMYPAYYPGPGTPGGPHYMHPPPPPHGGHHPQIHRSISQPMISQHGQMATLGRDGEGNEDNQDGATTVAVYGETGEGEGDESTTTAGTITEVDGGSMVTFSGKMGAGLDAAREVPLSVAAEVDNVAAAVEKLGLEGENDE
ncbi:hypothetical protein HDU76_003651 [Blyttiomyces sp. JEL0837]|nr:hypothetical protein HDU76_003651 [Blyttiomyces sp. JEL0837]